MHRATTTCHLANIAFRVGRRVYWDAERKRCYRAYDTAARHFVHEDGEANAYLLREPQRRIRDYLLTEGFTRTELSPGDRRTTRTSADIRRCRLGTAAAGRFATRLSPATPA
jgi:hypothetical protein